MSSCSLFAFGTHAGFLGCFPKGSCCPDEVRAEGAQQQLLSVGPEENAGNPKWITLLSTDADGVVCQLCGARFLQGGSQWP